VTRSVIVARTCVGRSVIQKNLTYFEIDDVPEREHFRFYVECNFNVYFS